MIQLFNIPVYSLSTSMFSNMLHDKVVTEFEREFAKYVGAKYAVSFNSATSAIELLFGHLFKFQTIYIPSMIPPVVPNAIINSGNKVRFMDDINWVGGPYTMYDDGLTKIIDSAQEVTFDQFKKESIRNHDEALIMIYSFYPTKPIGSCDGGMIVSNNKKLIEDLRTLSMNGMSQSENSWERKIEVIGRKMYMNSIQAYIALQNLEKLTDKRNKLFQLRRLYNKHLTLNNTSYHLYRISVNNQKKFIAKAKENGILCGIHYEPAHLNPLYNSKSTDFPLTEAASKTTVSIPFHENMSFDDVANVIHFVLENRNID